MKTEGQKAFERYMTGLANSGVKFHNMPSYETLNPVAISGWEAVANSIIKLHPDYEPALETVSVVEDLVIEPNPETTD
jgi:hypothetical protein